MGAVALFDLLILISFIALNDIQRMPLARQRREANPVVAGVGLAVVVLACKNLYRDTVRERYAPSPFSTKKVCAGKALMVLYVM